MGVQFWQPGCCSGPNGGPRPLAGLELIELVITPLLVWVLAARIYAGDKLVAHASATCLILHSHQG